MLQDEAYPAWRKSRATWAVAFRPRRFGREPRRSGQRARVIVLAAVAGRALSASVQRADEIEGRGTPKRSIYNFFESLSASRGPGLMPQAASEPFRKARHVRRFLFAPAPHSCLGASPTWLSPSRLLALALRWSCQSSAVVQSGRASGERTHPCGCGHSCAGSTSRASEPRSPKPQAPVPAPHPDASRMRPS